MRNRHLKSLTIVLICNNLIKATQSIQSESTVYTVTVCSLDAEIKEIFHVSEIELTNLKADLTRRYNTNLEPRDPYSYSFSEPKIEGNRVEINCVIKFRPYSLRNAGDLAEIRFMDILTQDEVYIKVFKNLQRIRLIGIQENILDALENDSKNPYYFDAPDEFYELFERLENSPCVYVNQRAVVPLYWFGYPISRGNQMNFYRVRQTLMLAEEIGIKTERKTDDILMTLIKLTTPHACIRGLASHFSTRKYSQTEYSLGYYKNECLMLEIHFNDRSEGAGNWYRWEHGALKRIEQYLRMQPRMDGEIRSIKILDKEFILQRSISVVHMDALLGQLLKHFDLLRERFEVLNLGFIPFYENIFEGFTFPAD